MWIVTRLAVAVLLAATAAPAAAQPGSPFKPAPDAKEPEETKDVTVVWQKNLSDAYRAAVAQKKPMLICFTDSSPIAAKQRQILTEGVLDRFRDRAVFVFADPDADDSFKNVKQKIAELGVKQFPTMVLVDTDLAELGRIEGSVARDEIEKRLLKLFKVPGVGWHNVQFDKSSWRDDLAKVYDKAVAAKLPVALLFVSPGCKPGDVCACTKYVADLIPMAGYREYATKAVFVLVEVPPAEARASADVLKALGQFLTAWNIDSMPTLVIADPTETGLKERGRVIGRWSPEEYFPRMALAFGPQVESPKIMRSGVKPLTTDDLIKYFDRIKAEGVTRTPEGGFKATFGYNYGSGTFNAPTELGVSENKWWVTARVDLGDMTNHPEKQKRIKDEVAAFRRMTIPHGSTQLTIEGGRVILTQDMFNDGAVFKQPQGLLMSVGESVKAFVLSVQGPPRK